MQSVKFLLALLFASFSLALSAQTLQQEQREMRRKYNNPMAPPVEQTKVSQVFKLRGYTDSTQIAFSPIASCKMSCLSLEEKDVRLVLKEGLVNTKLSDVASSEKKFVVDYDSGKKLRVSVTPRGYSLFVVSVSQIAQKDGCDCKQ